MAEGGYYSIAESDRGTTVTYPLNSDPEAEMDGVLKTFGLERKNLSDIRCPRDIIDSIAGELIGDSEWYFVARALEVSDKSLKSIHDDHTLTSLERKAVAALDAWAEEKGSKATCLKLAKALHDRKKRSTLESLCKKVKEMKRESAASLRLSAQSTPISHQLQENQWQRKAETSDMIKPLADKLTHGLSLVNQWKDVPEKSVTIAQNSAITDFITRSIESGVSLDDINEQLKKCYSEELLISKEVFTQAQQLAAKEHAKRRSASSSGILITPSESKATVFEPLFCKDTIYHAGICCQAVSMYTAGDYQKFFKKKDLVPGHGFKAVSFSRSKEETFLIARKGESTYYFAFKGRLNLSDWTKGFKCFSEGTMAQCSKFPIRYIIELLNKQRCVVLTGFSFGGLLASAVAASVWDTPYISSDLLKKNMTCITFGQPLVSVDIIQKVARRRPEIVTTVHAIFTEQDQLPSLMGLLDECWSEKAQTKSALGSQAAFQTSLKPFEDQATFNLLQKFAKLQIDFHVPESHEIIEDIKAYAHEVMLGDDRGATRQFTPSFTQHVLSVSGLLSPESRNAHHVKDLTAAIYTEHSMSEYCKSIFEHHLDKLPKYSFPETTLHALDDVPDLKPALHEIHIHHHGNESATDIQGSNLWFCYGVSFRKQKLAIPASDVSGSSIQFNGVAVLSESEDKKEYVSLDNHFKSKPIRQEVEVFERKYSTTTRQAQLAKLTPSQVIELGYLSALLERCGADSDGLYSHKFEVIKKFLEDVVKVVPFESIAYAITNGNSQTAMQCSTALETAKDKISKTMVMYTSLQDAIIRLQYGVPAKCIHSLECKANEMVKYTTSGGRVHMDSGKLVYELHTFLPGTLIPLCEPVKVQTVVKDAQQTNKELANKLDQLKISIFPDLHSSDQLRSLPVLSEKAIEEVYPIQSDGSSNLKSPLNILVDGRKRLAGLSMTSNQEMLKIVNTIRSSELDTCTSLLGGFMHQAFMEIELTTNKTSQSRRVNVIFTAQASVGVWALFSLDYNHIQPMLTQCQDEQLFVRLFDYVKGISGISHEPDESPYAAKLQFMVQGMTKSVTCNTQHVSYSLERQLVELCNERKIDANTPVSEITGKWSVFFREKTLSLVHHEYRLLVAKWLKWALMIHNLREELAKYTAVGVVGLVNSGKSKLVNTIFGIKIPTGTIESKRTTVPFLYNLDEKVEGLNVVDFPGVDDEDDSIGDLADLLITVAQIIVFVVDYRKVHTQSAKKWLERLQKEKVPTLVCLTFGDKLYAEHMTGPTKHPSVDHMSKVVKSQISVTREKLRSTGSHQTQFFSFCQDQDSVLNSDSGRKKLREVGIGTPLQVGEWLVKVFREDFKQNELADQLEVFVNKNAIASRVS